MSMWGGGGMCMWVLVPMEARDLDSLGLKLHSWEPLSTGAGNPTQVPWKNSASVLLTTEPSLFPREGADLP